MDFGAWWREAQRRNRRYLEVPLVVVGHSQSDGTDYYFNVPTGLGEVPAGVIDN
jgi:hypothetical protein